MSEPEEGAPQSRGGLVLVSTLAVALLAASPFLLVRYPRQLDAPNHLARHWIVASGDPTARTFWDVSWRIFPNLGGDLAGVGLQQVLGPVEAHRALWCWIVASWVAAPVWVHRALVGRWSPLPLLASLVALNVNVTLGFENYAFTAPLALAVFAGWVQARARSPILAFVWLILGSAAIYVGHAIAWGELVAMSVAYAVSQPGDRPATRARDGALAALPAVPPMLHYLLTQFLDPKPLGGTETHWGGGFIKLATLLLAPVLSFHGLPEIIVLGLLLTLVLVVFRQPGVRVAPSARGVLAVLAVLTVLMPEMLVGVAFSDTRLPPVLLAVLVASLDWRDPAPRVAAGVATGTAVAWALRLATLIPAWWRHDAEATALVEAGRVLPEGARVLVATTRDVPDASGDPMVARPRPGAQLLHLHTPSWLVPERKVFLPILFTHAHLVRLRPETRPLGSDDAPFLFTEDLLADGYGLPGRVPAHGARYWHDWRQKFTHLVVMGIGPVEQEVTAGLAPLVDEPGVKIYAISPIPYRP